MSDLIENTSIQSPQEALTPALNYQNLRNIGLDTIIETGSDIWTDYNEHDPGITILEMLIYSLTDLAYRTDFPLPDIIAQQQLSYDQLAEKQFYTARNILTTNPVTFDDLRKVIIDQKGVGNAWIEYTHDPFNTFGGLIDILVDPYPTLNSEKERDALRAIVEETYFGHRTLGQDLQKIIFREPLEVILNLDLIINPKAVAEQVVAELLFELETHLSSTVTFLSLEEMRIKANGDINQVFNGAPLLHGFLPDDALLPIRKELRVVDLIPILLKTPEVAMVPSLGLRTLAQEEAAYVKSMGLGGSAAKKGQWFNEIELSRSQSPQLAPTSQHVLRIQKGTTPVKLKLDQLEMELKKLNSKKRTSKLAPEQRDIPIPVGNFRDIKGYLSIQQEFPQIYGLDPFGPPPDATEMQKGKIMQMKAYLLIFDQLMADYLAQLANLGQLFSWDKEISRTYFFQGLETSVAKLGELLEDVPLDLAKGKDANKKLALGKALEEYKKKLALFREDETTFLSRRNRFLNHLLARFGQNLTAYTESISENTLAEQEKIGIETKLRVLDRYATLSAQRGRSYNRFKTHHFSDEFSGLRQWVETLFDMRPENLDVYRFNKRFVQNTYASKTNEKYVFSKYILTATDANDQPVAVDMKEVMRIGGDKDNYGVDYHKDKGHHIVLFKITDPIKPIKIYKLMETYESVEETLEAIDELAYLIGEYNKTSERIFLVDHLLLKPTPIEAYFGLALLNEKKEVWMKTASWYPKETLQQIQIPPDPTSQFYYCIKKSNKKCEKQVVDEKKSTKIKTVFKKINAQYVFSIQAIDTEASIKRYKVELQFGASGSEMKMYSTTPFESKKIARKAIKSWVKSLKKSFKSRPSDTVTLPWKPLLKPWHSSRFDLTLLNGEGKPWMTTDKWYPKETLQQIQIPPDLDSQFYYCIKSNKNCEKQIVDKEKSTTDKTVLKNVYAKYVFSIQPIDPKASTLKYTVVLHFGEKGKKVKMYSTIPFESKETAQQVIETWMESLENRLKTTPIVTKPPFWKSCPEPPPSRVKKLKKYQAILTDPYSFMLTVVIPKWPSRFQDKGFKKTLEKEIHSESPAHLWPNILWLDKVKYQQFQNMHYMWWSAYLDDDPDAYCYRKELMEFIMKLSLPKHKKHKQKQKKRTSKKKNG